MFSRELLIKGAFEKSNLPEICTTKENKEANFFDKKDDNDIFHHFGALDYEDVALVSVETPMENIDNSNSEKKIISWAQVIQGCFETPKEQSEYSKNKQYGAILTKKIKPGNIGNK